ncbi:MAG: 16S rRNA (cytidine(1402)-2'-O)-methyltransferase [Paracoccus sp. (in: a-proteobacteria)]|nr:16S rRNA (cytidine(1402)-2'-O)-methyltransferase [Paracoccus sp. (in: a-proteobacteria)]
MEPHDAAADGTPAERSGRIELRVERARLEPGLYLVATPIGAARDITLRGLDVLSSADLLAAEDTRVLRHLMEIHGIPLRGRRIIAYHEHSHDGARQQLLDAIAAGQAVAYASDAGTPMIADPGYRLAQEAIAAGATLRTVPGPSAVIAALTLSGLPSDRFTFAGFAPSAAGARRKFLSRLMAGDATAIFFESPRRVKQTLENICDIDANRSMVICREVTKKFEEVLRGTASELDSVVPSSGLKGEIVVLLDRAGAAEVTDDVIRQELAVRLVTMTVKDASAEVATLTGAARRDVYQIALKMGKGG